MKAELSFYDNNIIHHAERDDSNSSWYIPTFSINNKNIAFNTTSKKIAIFNLLKNVMNNYNAAIYELSSLNGDDDFMRMIERFLNKEIESYGICKWVQKENNENHLEYEIIPNTKDLYIRFTRSRTADLFRITDNTAVFIDTILSINYRSNQTQLNDIRKLL